MKNPYLILLVFGILFLNDSFAQTTVNLSSVADNSIYSENPSVSSGIGQLYVGQTCTGNNRRALLKFDLSSIPAGSTINSVSLQVNVNNVAPSAGNNDLHSLYPLIAQFGEGTSNGGGTGSTAVAPDATWSDAMLGTLVWATAGGDFNPTAVSTVQMNNSTGTKTFPTSGSFETLAQAWLDTPGANFGLILIGNESTTCTARRLGSKDIGTDPVLIVNYTPPCTLITGTDTRTECDSYQWIDGVTYSSNNNSATFNLVGGAANGCDSLVTLDLTIVNSTTGTDTRTECNSYQWIDGVTYTSSNNTATFNLVSAAANGCDSLVTLNLTINSVSDITTSTSGETITATNGSASYRWLDCDNNNTPISGATNQSYTSNINGNFAVELTENGCVDTSDCVAITSAGIIETNFGNKLIVFPNPSDGIFSIDLGSVYESVELSISDLNGKLIRSESFLGQQVLDVTLTAPNGIYIITVIAGDSNAKIKWMKG